MKDISFLRIVRWTIVSLIVCIGISFIFGTGTASAEMGEISVEAVYQKEYLPGQTATNVPDISKIYIDNTNYNKLNDFRISSTGMNYGATLSFVNSFESTPFTVTTGCAASCTGIAYYDKNTSSAYWVFYGLIPSSNVLTLSYDKTTYASNFSYTGTFTSASTPPSVNSPIMFGCTGGNNVSNPYQAFFYKSSLSLSVTDSYIVSYLPSGLFNVGVTKGKTLTTKHIIHGTSTEYSRESSFNAVDYSFVGTYADGLYINLTTASGTYSDVLINSSGSGAPTPTPTPVVNPLTHGGLLWNKNNYSKMENGILSYLFDPSWFESWTAHWIDIYKDGVKLQKFEGLGVSGSISYQFQESGSYTGKYYKCTLVGCLLPSLLDEKTVQVTAGNPSQLFLQPNYVYGQVSNISYYANPYQSLSMKIFHYSEAKEEYLLSVSSWLNPGYGNKTWSCGIAGTYKIQLDDAISYTKCIINTSLPQYNISTSYLNLLTETPSLSDYLMVDYGVSSAEWVGNSTYIIVEAGGVETFRYQLTKQMYIVPFFLVLTPNDFLDMVVKVGINEIKLINQDGTVLDNETITVSATTTEGFGLDFLKESYCVDEKIHFIYYSPDIINLSIYNSNEELVIKKTLNVSMITTGTSGYLVYKIPGTYDARLMDSNNIQRANNLFEISSCAVIEDTTDKGFDESTPSDILGSAWFWGAILIFTFAIAGGSAAGPLGFISGGTLGIIFGYLADFVPLWALFLFVVVAISGLCILVASKTGSE